MLYRAAGKTLDDPQWVDMGNPTGSSTSFNTQPTYVVPYTPANGKTYFVYMVSEHGAVDNAVLLYTTLQCCMLHPLPSY
jgi:hypothetical protein